MESTDWNPDGFNDAQVGSCVLESPLSISGIGAVFLARQERPHRSVAVKVIHRELARDLEAWSLFLARFQREADATAALEHANIMPIYEFGETGDIAYLVMPYLPDGSLATWLEQQGPLSLSQTVQYVEQVASALDYAHARGIIHRDVKPSNMLLHPDGRVLLADFGIARPMQLPDLTSELGPEMGGNGSNASLTQAGIILGTPEYMAPEQIRGDLLTPATDLYGLGIATYELLGGQTPFEGEDVPTVLQRQVMSPPPPLRIFRPDLPARVEEVIFWALAKDPADRPATASQFAKALRAALETEPRDSGDGRSLPGASSFGLVSAAQGQENGSRQQVLPEPVPRLPRSTPPLMPTGPDVAIDETHADESTIISAGPDSIGRHWVLNPPGGVGGYASKYAPGAPQRPLPQQKGPDKRVAIAAVFGLAMAIVALIIVAVHLVHSGQPSLTTSPSSTRMVLASPSPSSQQAAATSLPSTTRVPSTSTSLTPTSTSLTPTSTSLTPTSTAMPPTTWLVISPTQVALACNSTLMVTLQLTNVGPEAVSWVAQTSPSQSYLTIQPASGSLAAGTTQAITVRVSSGNPKFIQGTLPFKVVSGQQAGNPAQVSYTIAACGGV